MFICDMQLFWQEEIDYLKKYGIDWLWEKVKYFINQGVWGISVGGVEILIFDQILLEEVYFSLFM